jgi:purine-cytosine permease-like protein
MKAFLTKQFQALKKTDNHWLRHSIGVLLVIGGLLGFLPVLGYWMLPLGLALLAVDFPFVRRLYRRLSVWWGRLTARYRPFTNRVARTRNRLPKQKGGDNPGTGGGN